MVIFAVDLLGWAFHWGGTCNGVPPDCDQGHAIQVQVKQNLNSNLPSIMLELDYLGRGSLFFFVEVL